ncbi:MAG: hypothetical protein BWY11_00290 [Firmicutes bacterium ADurb.Bin182]|nr:MAG: hypothetical protein BWY11_00290 [Firmicutes bacterium ADurb.Bin182]
MRKQKKSYKALREEMEKERMNLNRLAEKIIQNRSKFNSPEVLKQYEAFNKYFNLLLRSPGPQQS